MVWTKRCPDGLSVRSSAGRMHDARRGDISLARIQANLYSGHVETAKRRSCFNTLVAFPWAFVNIPFLGVELEQEMTASGSLADEQLLNQRQAV